MPGMSVYDLVHGNGVVTRVVGLTFTASFGALTANYMNGGFFNNKPIRRVYWGNPILDIPPAPGENLESLRVAIQTLATLWRSR
jgi:hypothetical protein